MLFLFQSARVAAVSLQLLSVFVSMCEYEVYVILIYCELMLWLSSDCLKVDELDRFCGVLLQQQLQQLKSLNRFLFLCVGVGLIFSTPHCRLWKRLFFDFGLFFCCGLCVGSEFVPHCYVGFYVE